MSDKPICWVGSALDDLRAFPDDGRRRAGYELRRVRQGLMATDYRPLPSIGSGVQEMRIHTELEHRVLYTAKFEAAVYVLHAFEKRSRRIPRRDLDLARRRLAEVLRGRQPG